MTADDAKAKKGLACPKCGNRLRVRPDQRGEQVRCPKCGGTFTVGQRAAAPAASSLDPDAPYEPEIPLKRSTIVHDDPVRLDDGGPAPQIVPMQAPPTSHLPQYDTDWATADELELEERVETPPSSEHDYLELARRRGLVREEDPRPIPEWTFFSGVFSFPWQLANIARWATMSLGLLVSSGLLLAASFFMAGGVNTGTLALPILSLLSAAMLLVTLSFSAACFLAAVDDTADGHDEVQEVTLPPLDQWFFSFFSVLGIWLMSGAFGYPLAIVPAVGPFAVLISSVVLFPILLLSAMERDSFLFPFSGLIWRTMVESPGTWLAFYLISTLLLAAWLGATVLAAAYVPIVVVLMGGPVLAAVMLIYARLVGRLAWRIMLEPADVGRRPRPSVEPSKPAAVGRSKKHRKKVRQLKLPADLEQKPAAAEERREAPRTRLDFHKRP